MTKKIHERVLGENGQFEHFPERHLNKAVELEQREPVDPAPIDPLIPHGEKGKAELEAKKVKSKKK